MTREEAIEVVKERLDYYEREKRLKAACEVLIPELAESEDERIRRKMLEHFRSKTKETWCNIPVKDIITYLEKQKEQKPAEWSEEDEKIRHCIGLILTDAPEKRFKDYNLNLKECLVWLGNKTVNSSILPNKNDEKMLNRIIGHLSGFIYPNSLYCDDAKECISWLKSLRPSWKPSEEQMKALQNAVALTACDKELARLYNQLKKL